MPTIATAFWTRPDSSGRDLCRLVASPDGWRLEGRAVFHEDAQPCDLVYQVHCSQRWQTLSAQVNGVALGTRLELDISRTAGGHWTLNGQLQREAGSFVDLDLGFTPATNLIAIRRLATPDGVVVAAPAAYYLGFSQRLGMIEQTYRRTASDKLEYTAPGHNYAAELTVDPTGFVIDYPGLWRGRVYAGH